MQKEDLKLGRKNKVYTKGLPSLRELSPKFVSVSNVRSFSFNYPITSK